MKRAWFTEEQIVGRIEGGRGKGDAARCKIEKWRIEYNPERPHSSLGHLTREELAAENQMSSAIARIAWPTTRMLTGAVPCTAVLDPKTRPFFDRPQIMKGGRKNSG